MDRRYIPRLVGMLTLCLFAAACSVLTPVASSRPQVVINAPTAGTPIYLGQDVTIQVTATDPAGIARVEITVDGSVIRSQPSPSPVSTLTLTHTWKATAGSHGIGARAFNVANQALEPALITVMVLATPVAAPSVTAPAVPEPTATPVPSIAPNPTGTGAPPPNTTCVNNAAFVADVTIPDGTIISPDQTFTKVWRVRNTGTCTWDSSYLLTFIGGESMSRIAAFAVPNTPPGSTVDFRIDMVAPTAPGSHTGLWRIEGPNGVHFGTLLSVVIRIPGPPTVIPAPTAALAPTPGACSGTPIIESFNISPSSINSGNSATLSWGLVSNADRVQIDPGIGGVATPGSTTVSPGTTTTFTLTAFCGSNIAIAQVTLTVNSTFCSGTPNISSFSVAPSTITVGQTASLSWGPVSNASSVQIDNGIGGVSTPGNTTVTPQTTTTYTLTAACGASTATAQVTVTVNGAPVATATTTPKPVTVARCAFTSESGSISKTGSIMSAFQVGDDEDNNAFRAFFSYNLADLAQKTINSATLTIGTTNTRGNPFSLGPLNIETVQYTNLTPLLYGAPGVVIASTSSGPAGRYDIRSAVQTFVNAGRPRFQLRLSLAKETNSDDKADLFLWATNTVCITVTYH